MVKSTVQVCVRTRPTSNFAGENLKIDSDTKAITVHFPKAAGQTINNQQEDWSFKFDGVLHNATQEAVYDACARDIVDSVLEGYNGTILAYGQTGAGKTFTMSGGTQSYKYRGLIPRSISEVFRHIRAHPESAYLVRVSYLEIYNECYFDLLAEDGGSLQDLSVVDDDQGQVLVRELTQAVATSEEDALNLLFAGDTNRAIGEHHMNKQSSRSHAVFTMHIERRSRVESSEKLVVSKLNLVDLAGSERVKKTGSSGATLQEAKYINKSLTFLEQVVLALSEKNRDHIPFRQSKLTNVLRDSLGGNCRTRLIANIWSEAAQLEETLSTLKFATRMMRVSNEATINVQLDPDLLLRKYEREIRELKKELALHDMLSNRGTVSYEEYTPEQQQELQTTVQRYARGEQEDIELVNLRQMKELLRQFKLYCQSLESRMVSEASRSVGPAEIAISAPSPAPAAAAPKGQAAKQVDAAPAKPNVTVNVVGDIDESAGGFHIGIAPSDSAPAPSPAAKGPSSPTAPKGSSQSPRGQSLRSPTAKAEAPVAVEAPSRPARVLSEPEAFEEFKQLQGAGGELNQVYLENKDNLRDKKAKLKEATRAVNELKAQIDHATARVEAKRSDRELSAAASESEPEAKVIDEEEFALIRDIKKLKRDYVDQFNARKLLLSETEYIKGLVEQSQHALAKAFLDWYQVQYGQYLNETVDQPFQAEPKAVSSLSPKAAQGPAAGDALDDGEQFDRLEMQRVLEEEPESISFYNALKQTAHAGKKKAAAPTRTQKVRKNFV